MRRIGPLLLLVSAHAARAEEDRSVTQYVPDEDLAAQPAESREGWDGALALGANLSFNHNSSVIGQPDGLSFSLVASVVGEAEYRSGPHELNLKLSVYEGASMSPGIERVAKTGDLVKIEPRYSLYTFPWLGVYARANAEAPIFASEDLRAADVVYALKRSSGAIERQAARERPLAAALRPLTLTQSLGLVCRPIDALEGVMLVRIGAGGRQTFADGAQLVTDDAKTPEIELVALDDVLQAGAEMAIGVAGRFPEQRLSYDVDVSGLMPVLNNDPLHRTAFDLFRVGLVGNVSYHPNEYVGVSWQFKILQDPQLTASAQAQSLVLLTFQWQILEADRKRLSAEEAIERRRKAAEDRERAAEERERRANEALGGGAR